MRKQDNIEKEYYNQVKMLFKDHPTNWDEFKSIWETGDLRLAYLYVDRCIDNLHLENTIPEKIDTEFYWYIY